MIFLKKLWLAFLLLTLTSLTFASTIEVRGATFITPETHYFSVFHGKFNVTFKNDHIPYGSKVFLRYGWGGHHQYPFEWSTPSEKEMKAIAPYTWTLNLEKDVASRSGPTLTHLNFVVHILLPNGEEWWENGNTMAGFFAAKLTPPNGQIYTYQKNDPKIYSHRLPLEVIHR